MIASDLGLILAAILMTLWVAQPAGQVVLLSRHVRDDFNAVVPSVQQHYRQQLARLLLRLLLALILVGFLAYVSCAPL